MKTPLWLPIGSVRALVLLGITGVTLGMVFLAKPVPDELKVAFGAVWGMYVGTRLNATMNGNKGNNNVSKS